MKFLVETVIKDGPKNSGCRNADIDEFISDMTIHETKVFGLKIYSVHKTIFVTEHRLFSIPIKRRRREGWETHYLSPKP